MTVDASPDSVAQLQRAIEQLCHEVAELRHLLAALTLIISDGADTEFVESYELIVGWALEEFDPEILRECLAQYDLPPTPVMTQQVSETAALKPQPSHSQKQLFSNEEPHDEGADG